jgi:L-ascorbate metabolism protein UlaG (beta-lactamase superfamily)
MIRPILQNDAFLRDVQNAGKENDRLHLWWLGQSGFLIQWQGHHLLIDPYLSDSLTKKYSGTDKPHVRMTERVIAPERLDFIEVVTSSHNHTDHLDGETLIPLLKVNPNMSMIVSKANIKFSANRIQIPIERLTGIQVDSSPLIVGPFAFQAIPSAHDELETDDQGDNKFIGLIIMVGGKTIYHSGDCITYEGLEKRLNQWKIDLALLPINGRDPSRGVPGNFDAKEAVELARKINAELVVPCHYDMFEFNTVSPDNFADTARSLGQKYNILNCAERLDL